MSPKRRKFALNQDTERWFVLELDSRAVHCPRSIRSPHAACCSLKSAVRDSGLRCEGASFGLRVYFTELRFCDFPADVQQRSGNAQLEDASLELKAKDEALEQACRLKGRPFGAQVRQSGAW